ncbi:hypothetical protein EW146_g7866 [Bondarzewia mesenterica]|uniref:Uncharacterized protein n=1 Tax=Bondarzewia mesenterica TaxID=1095465 RepID=A0A4S4LIU9_9AGAM|nr:hypothetical protein EW146_g7866 [Bondarzewia mesenterica]
MRARLAELDTELNYLKFRIAEWKEFASADHEEYYGFRDYLLRKLSEHMITEMEILSAVLGGCLQFLRTSDVPAYCQSLIYAFMETASEGEINREMHIEEWTRYSRAKSQDDDDTPSMIHLFDRMRDEIALLEEKSSRFRRMLEEFLVLVAQVEDMNSKHMHLCRRPWDYAARGCAGTPLRSWVTASTISASRSSLPPILSDEDSDLSV